MRKLLRCKTFNKTLKWDYKKKEKGVLHMLAPRRRYPDYSKVCSDVTERWLSVWNQNKHCIYHILYTNSRYQWANKHN